jgi:transporter family-2 protein
MAWFFALFLGTVGILQGGINKQMANDIGVAQSTLVGNLLTAVFSIAFFYLVKFKPGYFPDFFHIKSSPLVTWQWWYLIPAFFGICIVMGLPFSIYKLGAIKVTVGLIAAQMITSVAWDLIVEKLTLSPVKILGLALAASSVAVLMWEKSNVS